MTQKILHILEGSESNKKNFSHSREINFQPFLHFLKDNSLNNEEQFYQEEIYPRTKMIVQNRQQSIKIQVTKNIINRIMNPMILRNYQLICKLMN